MAKELFATAPARVIDKQDQNFEPQWHALASGSTTQFPLTHLNPLSLLKARHDDLVQFGLYDTADGERRLTGVAVFEVPVNTAVLTKPLPELRPSANPA
ncbi:hypothetical protein [Streptomyces albogriseolus]|uniref:hypothetical protein n=1 Tax=Streptomyces albogriseolus TaxID=1887 RepID=UPI0038185C6A